LVVLSHACVAQKDDAARREGPSCFGRLTAHTKLKPGTYRVNANAAAGTRRSAARALTFTIAK
jgi:hypothetical protein